MVFALGFLLCGLLTLLFLPAFWRRAVRLSVRRVEMQMPLSMAEIVAERDQLRAEFAAEHRRIERKAEELGEARARDMGELGRRAAQLAALDSELGDVKREALSLRGQIVVHERAIQELEGALGAANIGMNEADALVQRRSADFAGLERDYNELADVAEERRTVIAGLETRVSGLELRLLDAEREISRAHAMTADKASAFELAARERDFARNDIGLLNQKRDALQARIDEQTTQIESLENALRTAQRAHTKLLQHTSDVERDLAAAAERETELRAAVAQQAQAADLLDRAHAERLEAMRAELSMLQGALEALRRETAQTRHAAPATLSTPAAAPQDADLLRQAIVDVGGEIARLAAALQQQPADSAETASLAERMRQLQARAGRTA